jgi:hypothetical protein
VSVVVLVLVVVVLALVSAALVFDVDLVAPLKAERDSRLDRLCL